MNKIREVSWTSSSTPAIAVSWCATRFEFGANIVVLGCGVPNREGKVVEGEFMGPHEYPWLVLVHVTGRKSFLGSLISSKYVLCTASALKRLVQLTLFIFNLLWAVLKRNAF